MGQCDFGSARVGNTVHKCKETEYTLWLKHTKEYNLINAYNLSVMSILAYSDVNTDKNHVPDRDVSDFFKKFQNKQKLNVAKKDKQSDTTPINQFFKEVCKDSDEGIQKFGHMIDKDTSTEAFWFADAENIVLAVRGTQEIKEDVFQIDLDGEQVNMAGVKGQVHQGFKVQAETIINNPSFRAFTTAADGKKLFITGHSLGAAVATILSAYLKDKGHDPLLYTYGSPRTGNEDFVKAYVGITHYRHVYHHDIVPIIPGRNLDIGTKTLAICGSLGGALGIYLCSKNWSGTGYYHHGDLCQIISAGSKSIMGPFEGHGIVSDSIKKLVDARKKSYLDLLKVLKKGADANHDGYVSGSEYSAYMTEYLIARGKAAKSIRALKKLPADRNDDTGLVSTIINGQISDHFMAVGYMPFLKEEIKTQWNLYKQNNCKENSINSTPSDDTYKRIQTAIDRVNVEIKRHTEAIKSIYASGAMNDQLTAGRIDMYHATQKALEIHQELRKTAEHDLIKLEKMKNVKIGTYSIYSLHTGDPELNRQLEKFR